MKKIIIMFMLAALWLGPYAQAVDHFVVVRASTPLIVSGAVGLRLGQSYGLLRPTAQAEAGMGGGKLAFGWDHTGEDRTGYALKVAFLQTWIEPIDVDEDQSFIGLEAELSVHKLLLNLGGYRRVGSGNDGWLASAGLGFIF